MVLPLLIAIFAPEIVKRVVKAREDIIFTLQDWISDCLFSAFLCEEADAFDTIHDYMEVMDAFIKAYCFIIPLPILVAYAGDEIRKDPVLECYFSQFPSVREHLELQAQGVPYTYTGYDEELLDNIAKYLPFGEEGFKKWKEESGSIFDYFKMIWDTINSLWSAYSEEPMNFVRHVLQEFSQVDYPAELFHIPKELVYVLNPFIAIDWTVIKTSIQCYYAFEKYALNMELAKYPKAFVEGQWIWLEYNSDMLAKTELDADGHFELEGEFKGERWKDVKINTHGLIYLKEIAELCSLFAINPIDTYEWIEGSETKWTKVVIFTTPDFQTYIELRFEDMKNQPNPDFDYNDTIITFKEVDNQYYEVKIYRGEHGYTIDIYFRGEFLCRNSPEGEFWDVIWQGKIDKKTLTIIWE